MPYSIFAAMSSKGLTASDIHSIRQAFPILDQKINGYPLVYLDNGATSQTPLEVVNAIQKYYLEYNSNIHRGVHTLSGKATDAYEAARETVRAFINARSKREVNFVRGTTEAINLVMNAFGKKFIKKGDEIIISNLEHHSNIVPWQMLCEAVGAKLLVIPILDNATIDMAAYKAMLSENTKLVSVVHTSNSTGIVNPVVEMTALAHSAGAKVLLDGAQAAPHTPLDVQALDCDFFCFSAHKMYGPTGMGILYGKEAVLEEMNPYMGGGEMIKEVTFEQTTYNDLPYKFEAGTPNICGGIALAAACDFMTNIGVQAIHDYEQDLLEYGSKLLNAIDGLKIIGNEAARAAVMSFTVEGVHPYDIGVILDNLGIAVRTGHHCCQPVMDRFGIPGTCRASLAVYNTKEELDKLQSGLKKALSMLR